MVYNWEDPDSGSKYETFSDFKIAELSIFYRFFKNRTYCPILWGMGRPSNICLLLEIGISQFNSLRDDHK